MSVFDDEVRTDEAAIFAEAGDLADYQGADVSASDIYVVVDKAFEIYDADQLAMRVTTISVRSADVARVSQGDTIKLPPRTWVVQQILEDDGHVRRLWVS